MLVAFAISGKMDFFVRGAEDAGDVARIVGLARWGMDEGTMGAW